MACFAAPAVEAVVTAIIAKNHKDKETESSKIPFSRKLKWLSNMLWGGSALLAFEHVWHGEIIAEFPFLTAAQSAEGINEMLLEMATVGIGMTVAVTALWGAMLLVVRSIEKKRARELAEEN